jgi:hypothetical protein
MLMIRGGDCARRINRHDAFARRQIRNVEKLKADLAIQCLLFGIDEAAAGGNKRVVSAAIGNYPTAFGSHQVSAAIV